MSKRSLVLAAMAMTVCGALSSALVAQHPLPGLPMTAPPVDHPGLAAQPLFGSQPGNEASEPSPAKKAKQPPMPTKPPAALETTGPKRVGKELKSAVAAVNKLHWFDKLGDARVRAAASGKPILFIQALGDLEGFA